MEGCQNRAVTDPRAKEETGFTPTPQCPKTYRRCGSAGRRLRSVGEEASSQSGADLQWDSGVTFWAFSVSGDRGPSLCA